ncbi:MAG: CapA family protein [Bacteroidales bacterium]|nr:CapA family protein [Bacteroidales bacterium]
MIKILITGDFCPIGRIEHLSKEGNYRSIFNDFYSVLQGNHLNITNLESPIYNGSKPIFKTGLNIKADESVVKTLAYGGFDLVTLANNHIMDFGQEGLKSTIKICKREKISIVGAGFNLQEARKIFYKRIQGKICAILNMAENEWSTTTGEMPGSNPYNPITAYYDIQEAKKKADYVILIVHGGHQHYPLPSPRMVETYRFFIDAGANIIIGHHPHCFSGYEKYNGGFIFYSLGNFIFDRGHYKDDDWNYGYAVKLLISEKDLSFKIIPYKQCTRMPGVLLLNDSEKQAFNNKIHKLSSIVSDDKLLLKEWSLFTKTKKDSYLLYFEFCKFRIYKSLRYRKLIPRLLSKRSMRILLNILRCESHKEMAIESLKLELKLD